MELFKKPKYLFLISKEATNCSLLDSKRCKEEM